jgi:tRNA/rRNA methyltransferase
MERLVPLIFFLFIMFGSKLGKSFHGRSLKSKWSTSIDMQSSSFEGYKAAETKRDAYRHAREARIRLPCVVLVSPYLDRNVGSVSRAMMNFGLWDLRLVDPRCDHLSEQAKAIAAGSVEVLENAKVFPTLTEAVSDLNRVIATTARPRKITQLVYTPEACAEACVLSTKDISSGIVFGPESSGLTNDDIALADAIVSIPTFKHFSSLNLAQAVNCLGYEIYKRQIHLENESPPSEWLHPKDGERLAKREELDSFLCRLETELNARNYQSSPERRALCHRNVRSILQRPMMTKAEVDTLQGVLTTLLKHK